MLSCHSLTRFSVSWVTFFDWRTLHVAHGSRMDGKDSKYWSISTKKVFFNKNIVT